MYRFTNFVEWPDDRPEAPFLICVIADSGMGHALRVLVREAKAVATRPIQIRTGDARLAQSSCEILFIGRAAERRLADIVAKSAGKPRLLVGDTEGFARRGVAIELFQKPNVLRNRLRLGFHMIRTSCPRAIYSICSRRIMTATSMKRSYGNSTRPR
ncbi:MAG TPA: hypothetical protein DDY14_11380, partial [Chromatiaceae bacterium]|nr:hypothetical protein [Chromatiaceae bacterium]